MDWRRWFSRRGLRALLLAALLAGALSCADPLDLPYPAPPPPEAP